MTHQITDEEDVISFFPPFPYDSLEDIASLSRKRKDLRKKREMSLWPYFDGALDSLSSLLSVTRERGRNCNAVRSVDSTIQKSCPRESIKGIG